MKERPTPKDFSLKSFIKYCNVLGIKDITKLPSTHPFKNLVSPSNQLLLIVMACEAFRCLSLSTQTHL